MILGGISAVAGLIATGLLFTGSGAAAAPVFGQISMYTGVAPTIITCSAKLDQWCYISTFGSVLGIGGGLLKVVGPFARVTASDVKIANIQGNLMVAAWNALGIGGSSYSGGGGGNGD